MKKKRIISIVLCLIGLFACKKTFAQNSVGKQEPFQTNILIHTSKPYYLPGEKIWLSAYLLNASTHQLLLHKHPLYVQLYAADGNLISNQILYTEAGRGSGVVALPPSTLLGVYRLQAFTQSMVMAKQPNYEQRIYVGIKPTVSESNTKIKNSEQLKITTDATTYSQRSPVQLLLHSDNILEATISVSVYKEESISINNMLAVPSKISTTQAIEPAEQLLYMGRAMRPNGSPITNGQVVLLVNLPNGQRPFVASTDSTGFFIFNNLLFEGDPTTYWQVNNTKGKLISDATIHWIKFPRIAIKIDSLPSIKEPQILQQPAVFKSDGDSLAADTKTLDEVTVKAKKQETSLLGLPLLHKDTDVNFSVNFENNQIPDFKDMLKLLPACSTGDPPKYLIDGLVVNNPEDFIDTRQIKRIEFLRGNNGIIYGSTCVYAIYTYSLEKDTKKRETTPAKIIKLQSYQPIQAFYSPNYDNQSASAKDTRQTLYWNPALILEPKQRDISLRFFSSNVSGTYRIVVQGMSNGSLIYTETNFRIE